MTRRLVLAALIAVSLVSPGLAAAQPHPDAPAPDRTLRPELLGRLLALIAEKGRDGDLPAAISTALGLVPTAQTWADRQFAVISDVNGEVHAVAVSRGTDQDLVFSSRGEVAITIFRVQRDGTVVSAVNFFPQSQQSGSVPLALARNQFADECLFWTQALAKLGSGEP
jgi:hypothetical protein